MSKKAKQTKKMKAHIVGTIKPEHVPTFVTKLSEFPLIEPLPPSNLPVEPTETLPEDHLVVAVPKSAWEKIKEFFC
jgi:hypothetical protein